MTKVSIAIPAYEYNGNGVECLEYSFNKMLIQTFKDFDTVVSDHSKDDKIEILCDSWKDKLNIKYVRNEKDRGNPASNANNAIKNCEGEIVKFICQDDYLSNDKALESTLELFKSGEVWVATAYIHTFDRVNYERYHFPSWNNDIMVINTIGTPSCIAFRNLDGLPKFDKKLSYCYDCDFYYQMYLKYGQPRMGFAVTMANYLWKESITAGISQELIDKENKYILKKHGFTK